MRAARNTVSTSACPLGVRPNGITINTNSAPITIVPHEMLAVAFFFHLGVMIFLDVIKTHPKASTCVLNRLKTPRVEKASPCWEPRGRCWSLQWVDVWAPPDFHCGPNIVQESLRFGACRPLDVSRTPFFDNFQVRIKTKITWIDLNTPNQRMYSYNMGVNV